MCTRLRKFFVSFGFFFLQKHVNTLHSAVSNDTVVTRLQLRGGGLSLCSHLHSDPLTYAASDSCNAKATQ